MNKSNIKYTVYKDGLFYVVKSLNFPLASQGKTRKSAIKNFMEAYKLLKER